MPGAIGDAFVRLGHRVAVLRLEQKKVAVLVDRLPAEPEVPVDHADRSVQHEVVEPRLLADLAPCRDRRGLGDLEVALGKAPVAIGVPDQQEVRLAVRSPPEYHSARTRLPLRATLLPAHPATPHPMRNVECGMRNGPRECRVERPAPGIDLPLQFRIWHSAFRICLLEHAKREVFSRIRLNVGQELPQLDHGERVSRYSVESDTSSPSVPLRLAMRDITLSADTSTRTRLSWFLCAASSRS